MTDNAQTPLWQPAPIRPGMYCNAEPLIGFQVATGPQGNPLHPDTSPGFESELEQVFLQQAVRQPELFLKRVHMSMPGLNPAALPEPRDYQPVAAPAALSSTSITAALISQQAIRHASLGYHFHDNVLHGLSERLTGQDKGRGLCGNLGYFMTRELNCGDHPWSHRRRYPKPEHQLPEVLSYLGFYHFAAEHDSQTGKQHPPSSGFQGAHPGAVAVNRAGQIEILPAVQIDGYELEIERQTLSVDCINPELSQQAQWPVALFTPGYPLEHAGQLVDFAPLLPLGDRVNLFIANHGDGQRPHEAVVKVWQGACPLPSFGALLSIERSHFESLFAGQDLTACSVKVTPHSRQLDLANYRQILGGLVPAVINGKPVVPTGNPYTAQQAEAALNAIAGTDTPLARTGKETNNFDSLIREPAGLFVQTRTRVGWLLFDGRHEMSIGANIVDVSNLVQRLQQPDIDLFDGETIIHALVVDGGSAMKVYGVENRGEAPEIQLLNRVAAGGRNGPGRDPRGLNLYSTAHFTLG